MKRGHVEANVLVLVHARAPRLRPGDGVQRHLGRGHDRRRRCELLPEAPGDLRRDRARSPGRLRPRGLPKAEAAGADPPRRELRAARRRARDRRADQRGAPLQKFGAASFQPSELAKLAIVIWAAAYLARRGAPKTAGELIKPLGLVFGLFALLVLLEPDLGTVVTVAVVLGGMLLLAGAPIRLLVQSGVVVVVLGLAAIWMEPYRRERVLAFIDPWQDSQGTGFQIVQAMIGMGSVGLHGNGLGESVQKINYLPEAHTDMIAAVVGEELGLVGMTLLIAAYVAFAGRDRNRARLSRPVCQGARGRTDDPRLRPGGDQPRRGGRDRPAHGDYAAVRLVRRHEPRRLARRRGLLLNIARGVPRPAPRA